MEGVEIRRIFSPHPAAATDGVFEDVADLSIKFSACKVGAKDSKPKPKTKPTRLGSFALLGVVEGAT